jgi:hypothetical protein
MLLSDPIERIAIDIADRTDSYAPGRDHLLKVCSSATTDADKRQVQYVVGTVRLGDLRA